MRQVLNRHPDSRCDAAIKIEADAARSRAGLLELRYVVTGEIGALRLPPVAPTARTDELRRSTCFEAFLRAAPDTAYFEFNFAPTTQWAAYRFDGYRTAMRTASEIGAPRISVRSDATRYELQVSLDLERLPDLPGGAIWQFGLSAVIEETSGRKSYWALAHPSGKPDFHHSDCFALAVPTA